MKTYNEYKDSGIEWLGQTPAHWEVKKLKHATKINPTKSEVNTIKNLDVTFLPMENLSVNGKLDLSLTKYISEVYSGFTYFVDNIIIAKITPCFENGKAALAFGLKNGIGFGTTELDIPRPKQRSDFVAEWIIPISPLSEQQQIADYLDQHTAKIDELII